MAAAIERSSSVKHRITPRAFQAIAALAILTGAAMACSSSGETEEPVGSTFIAFAKDFQPFRDWESLPAEPFSEAPTSTHTSGPRTVYINKMPPAGATEFPVGTIIVKEAETDPASERAVFAMVKRGGTFNSKGAANWEWFELQNLDSGAENIVWRGVGPPVGEKYGGDPNGGCNGCHGAATDNDFVLDKNLRLGE